MYNYEAEVHKICDEIHLFIFIKSARQKVKSAFSSTEGMYNYPIAYGIEYV